MQWELINGTVVTPQRVISKGYLGINKNVIEKVATAKEAMNKSIQVEINDLIVFPGLIDCHDHLLGTYLPRVGDRRPYMNWLMWDNDLKSSPIYAERQQIDSKELYRMGAFRHLITGVTSVQDHIPHFVREMFSHDLPIRLISDYALAHSVGSFALPWGEGIEKEHELAKEKNIPFITHCSEGFDKETKRSVQVLNESNALSQNTVLIHGIAFSDSDIDLLRQKKVNVVWCPVSNLYMFEKTAPIQKLLDRGVNVCLGTDSPMSGSVNIFEEFFVAKSFYKKTYGEELSDRTLVEMVTTNASKAMCLPSLGSLEEGNLADFIVIQGDKSNPYSSLVNMDFEKVMLVVIDGKPRFGDDSFIPLFEALEVPFQKIKVAGSKKVIEGDVLGLLERVRQSVGFRKELEYLPVEPW